MSTFALLAKKILKDTGLVLTDLKRKYPSIHQRGSGAFVWVAMSGVEDCGSTLSATELLARNKIEIMEQSSHGQMIEFI
jgi:hypothetical protein